MESRFGHDFSRVRVHADGRAAESARAVSASAYTVGSDIVFAAGAYSPGSIRTERLLLHELTHVVQQSGARGGTPKLGAPDNAFERQASGVARGTVSPASAVAAPLRAPLEIQRNEADEYVSSAGDWSGALDHELLAARLLHLAVEGGRPNRVITSLDALTGFYAADRDDVALAFINYAHSSGRLATLASTEGGRILLDRLIEELRGFPSFADEQAAATLAENAVREGERQAQEARAARVRFLSGQSDHARFLDWVIDANLDRLSQDDLLIVARALARAPGWPEFNRLPEQNRHVLLGMITQMAALLAARAQREEQARAAIAEFDRTTGRITALRPSVREELAVLTGMGPFALIGFYSSLISGHNIHTAIAAGQSLAAFDGLVQAAGLTTGALRARGVAPSGGVATMGRENLNAPLPHVAAAPSPGRGPSSTGPLRPGGGWTPQVRVPGPSAGGVRATEPSRAQGARVAPRGQVAQEPSGAETRSSAADVSSAESSGGTRASGASQGGPPGSSGRPPGGGGGPGGPGGRPPLSPEAERAIRDVHARLLSDLQQLPTRGENRLPNVRPFPTDAQLRRSPADDRFVRTVHRVRAAIDRGRANTGSAAAEVAEFFSQIHREALELQSRSRGQSPRVVQGITVLMSNAALADQGVVVRDFLTRALRRRLHRGGIRVRLVPRENVADFFADVIGRGGAFVDRPFAGTEHGELSHSFQLAYLQPVIEARGSEAGEAEGVTVAEFMRWMSSTPTRQLVWRHIFDATNRSLIEPERMSTAIRNALDAAVNSSASEAPRPTWR